MSLFLACSLFCQANITFYATYQSHVLDPSIASSWTLSLYKQGERLMQEYVYNKESILLPTDEGSYTYKTGFNHKGTVNDGVTVVLKTGLFRYLLYDSNGKPLQDVTVKIFEDGDEIKSITTNSEGIAECYLAECDKYAYRACNSSGSFAIAADKETFIKDRGVSVMLKYQDIPIPGVYSCVADDGSESPSARIHSTSKSGKLTFSCRYGRSYRIKNEYDVYSEPFTPTAYNNSFVVEHRKVTFVSGDDDPNILYDFDVLGANQTLSYGAKKVSDGKGYVVYYLMPGKYKYSHLGSMVRFEVGNCDTTLTLISKQKEIRLIDNLGNGVGGQKVKIIDNKGAESQEYVSDDSGIVSFKSIGDDIYVQVNGFGQFPVHTYDTQDIQMTKLTFENAVFDNATSITLTDGNKTLSVNRGHCLWVPSENQYTYSVFNGTHCMVNSVTIDVGGGSVDVGADFNTVTFAASEENGTPLSGFRFYVFNGSTVVFNGYTDCSGECKVYLKDGFYEFKSQLMQVIEAMSIDDDQMIRYSVPSEKVLTVNVDDKPWNGYVSFTNEKGESISMTCLQGVGKVCLLENEQFEVAVGSMAHTCKVNVADGMTLDFYTAHISSQGDGLAFPVVSYYYDNTHTRMLGGENLHLVAVPAANSSFKHWLINGEKYESGIVDYKVRTALNAIAVFESTEHAMIESISESKSSLDIAITDNCLLFSRDVCGNVDIYDVSGVKVRSAYVVSNRMDVYDLIPGMYIVVLTEKSSQYSSKVMKE